MTQTISNFRLGWMTDPHLNFCTLPKLQELSCAIDNQKLNALVITGDIAEGDTIRGYISDLQLRVNTPIFFVLGNHDYYMSTIEHVRKIMVESFSNNSNLGKEQLETTTTATWLPAVKEHFVELTQDVALCGHDGWYDGGYANWFKSNIVMGDYQLIGEFKFIPRELLFQKLQKLAQESAMYVRNVLPKAFEKHSHVFLATHVPVFAENAVYNGKVSDNNWMPLFSNKHMGDSILEVMENYPSKKLTILQGHSHGKARFYPKPNIESLTGEAKYRFPKINNIFVF